MVGQDHPTKEDGTTATSLAALIEKGPGHVRNTPIDNYFNTLKTELIDKLQDYNQLDTPLHIFLGFTNHESFVSYLLKRITDLYALIDEQPKIEKDGSEILPISLHDLRYLDELINLLIIHGIDAYLPNDIRIPPEEKQINKFKSDIKEKKYDISKIEGQNNDVLLKIINTICPIVLNIKNSSSTNYLSSIMVNGVMFPNLFILVLYTTTIVKVSSPYNIDLLEDIQETYAMIKTYNTFIQTIRNSTIKGLILNKLSTLPLRRTENGLLSLIDFILGVREQEEINVQNFARLNQILLTKPKSMNNMTYLTNLFEQIYEALKYVNRPLVISAVNGAITEFYIRNKRIVRDFLFSKIYKIFLNDPVTTHTYSELNDCVNIVISLSKNSSKELLTDFVTRNTQSNEKVDLSFFQYMWVYAVFLKRSENLTPNGLVLEEKESKSTERVAYYQVILSLLKTLILSTGHSKEILAMISSNILHYDHELWCYKIDLSTNLPYIETKNITIADEVKLESKPMDEDFKKVTALLNDMDLVSELFVEFLKLLDNPEVTKNVFLNVFRRWIEDTSIRNKKKKEPNFLGMNNKDQDNSILVLMNLKLSQHLNNEFKSDIIQKEEDILIVIVELIDFIKNSDEEKPTKVEVDSDDEGDSDDEDGSATALIDEESGTSISIILALLEAVINSRSTSQLSKYKSLLIQINDKLSRFYPNEYQELRNKLIAIISYNKGKNDSKQEEDKRALDQDRLDQAIAKLADPLIPIRVHGLVELRKLVADKSTVITAERVVKIHLDYLSNSDAFIYLNVIKGMNELLSIKNIGDDVLTVLFKQYTSPRTKLDQVLKIGEIFINYVQTQGQLFVGPNANKMIELCLDKVHVSTDKKPVDDRIRMSALSILGVCIQTNSIPQEKLRDIFDCVFGILQLETTEDRAIMRRAAAHIVHDYLLLQNDTTSLLSFPEPYTKQKLTTLLEYVKQQDTDYLVHQQVSTLLEELALF